MSVIKFMKKKMDMNQMKAFLLILGKCGFIKKPSLSGNSIIALLMLGGLLTGCGQKGPLFLPSTATTASTSAPLPASGSISSNTTTPFNPALASSAPP